MSEKLNVRLMGAEDLARAIDWAAREGWNPGLDDTNAFHAADRTGYFMGILGDRPVSAISLVKYGTGFAFLGLYIVDPEFRGRGFGLETWNAGLASVEGRTIGLDGVVSQQDNYRKSGFVFAHNNIRYGGTVEVTADENPAVTPVTAELVKTIMDYDRDLFPAERGVFLENWLTGSKTRHALAWHDGDRLCGFGVIRACREGHKIGPLFADSSEIAGRLLNRLVADSGAGMIFLDVPQPNGDAVKLAEDLGLSPVFETARMYRGRQIELPLERIFGISTFELG